MKYTIQTFGCQQNEADSQRIAALYEQKGYVRVDSFKEANIVVINTCMVREKAENRVYGLVNNLKKIKEEKYKANVPYKIIVTGCMIGAALRDKTGKFFKKIREAMPVVDEFLPIEEIGFDMEPIRTSSTHAWVPITNGCNNFCTFCIVPFTRGREISRPYEDILAECRSLKDKNFETITLLGQNVNSYGADLIVGQGNIQAMRDIEKTYFDEKPPSFEHIKEYVVEGRALRPVFVKHLGRARIPTLFPFLLADIANMGFKHVDFISSNPWDFTDELIEVIAQNPNITRTIHLPVQSGDDNVLKRMNRWYSAAEYINLIKKMRAKIPGVSFTTDIIVGFCGETDEEFMNTVRLVQEVGFEKAYISIYSPRPLTAASKVFKDDVPHTVKKQRWQFLDRIINAKYYKNKN